ncbi:MAG: hypothetical protein QNJ13_01745 [Paracoccaceae bacterium]|nr:hypothetical protein [Paracoccaceae bacterium]
MRGLSRLLALFVLPLVLAACGGPAEPVWAPQPAVEAARFKHAGPAKVTLFTVQSTATGGGAHAGLMISGRERVLFDPAGTFGHPRAPERNDVHYGITEDVEKVYIDYHARETYNVEIAEIAVSRAEADALIGAVEAYGAVPKAQCSLAVTRVLNTLPRFRSVPVTFFPNAASRAFRAQPGATVRRITDDDADENHGVLIRAREELAAMGLTPAN